VTRSIAAYKLWWRNCLTEAVGLHHFAATVDPAEVSAHLHDFGYAIIDNVVSDDVMDRFAAEVAPFVEYSSSGRDEYNGRFTKRTGALISRCPTARELVMHPTVVSTVQQFLSHVTAVQLHLTQLITISPDETAQKLHRDQMAFDFYPFPSSYHVQCNTMWALTDFTAENGATHIMPGTSTMDDEAALLVTGAQAEMRRGSVLFYDGKVLHGGGANRSSGVRRGVNITYAVGWVRQEENQFLATSAEVARTLDDDLLKMMGYQQGAFALGYVGDQQDPLSLLRGEHRKVKVIGDIAPNTDDLRTFVTDLADE
jgi:ectoine hydroxylase-related dioxygenase (phytanoyl-CoA dioxygenase family)